MRSAGGQGEVGARPEPNDLVREALSAGRFPRRTLEALAKSDPTKASDALLAALGAASDSRSYNRIVQGLARLESDAAFAALVREARQQRRFPRLAVRALGASRRRSATSELEALLGASRGPRRVTAALVLAERKSALAVEPLLALFRAGGRYAPAALRALRRFGRVPALARAVLADARIDGRSAARILRSVPPDLRIGLFARPFDPQAFLDREAANPRSPVRDAARAAGEALRDATMLLRAGAADPGESLLRAASATSADDEGDDLLRAADSPGSEEPEEAHGDPASWWRRLLDRVL